MIDLSNWREIYDTISPGRREKYWLESPDKKQVGLFKYPKTDKSTDFISEFISYKICEQLNIPVAKVSIACLNNRIGSLSYKIDGQLLDGVTILSSFYEDYSTKKMIDEKTNKYYSIEMILTSLKEYGLDKDFIPVVIIDYLIGNSDRHHSNWALNIIDGNYYLAPLYDNGSSLCCYVEEEKIDSYFKDNCRFNALITTKSRSVIRIHGEKNKPTHIEMLNYILENYEHETLDFIDNILENINEKFIDDLLAHDDISSLISNNRKKLIKLFLLAKIEYLKNLILK